MSQENSLEPEHGPDLNPDQELKKGIDEFNSGQYFECHETLEDLWRKMAVEVEISTAQELSEKQLVQGIIQVAVAYHHLRRGNVKGARRLFERALPRLRQAQATSLGLDVLSLLAHVQSDAQKITGLGDTVKPEAISVQVLPLINPSCQIVAARPLK